MSVLASYLPFHVEHTHGRRCHVLRDFPVSGQLCFRECVIEEGKDGERRLRSLDVLLSASYVNPMFDCLYAVPSKEGRHRMTVRPCDKDGYCLHIMEGQERAVLSSFWRYVHGSGSHLTFFLDSLYVFGFEERSPVDWFLDELDVFEREMSRGDGLEACLSVDISRGCIRFDALRWLWKRAVPEMDCPMVLGGWTSFEVEQGKFHLVYDGCRTFVPSGEREGRRDVHCYTFCSRGWGACGSDMSAVNEGDSSVSGDDMDGGESLGVRGSVPFSDGVAGLEGEAGGLVWEWVDAECPTISSMHLAVENQEMLSREVVRLALDELELKLPLELRPVALYMFHRWAPQCDDVLRLSLLSSEDDSSPFSLCILKEIYRNEHNDTMLLSMIQRQMDESLQSPHQFIFYGLEYVGVLISLEYQTLAIRRLEEMKAFVYKYGTTDEYIEFASACHRAQYTGMAIHFLRHAMKLAEEGEGWGRLGDVTRLGVRLANIMLEHNEPIQSVMMVCSRVLSVNPCHIGTLEMMGQCLETSNRVVEAADMYQRCFELQLREWEKCRFEGSGAGEEEVRDGAVRIAVVLERLYETLERIPLRCLVLRHHLRLDPCSMVVLSRLLKDLETTGSFHEMVQVCLEFLKNNVSLDVKDEIAIHLTLYNIYERELGLTTDAEYHLNCARGLNANDVRVLYAEISRCRRRGLQEEEIGHRLALIEILPASEAIEETLSLTRFYEMIQAPTSKIMDSLRRMNGRYPNHPLILLELRHYLRKSGQSFELASVLERLARVTQDLQTRRSMLLEASEVHEKLGNLQISKALFHEAQLCSPIDPAGRGRFVPDKFCPVFTPLGAVYSSLSSAVLTSRSLSVVDVLEGGEVSGHLEGTSGEASGEALVSETSLESEVQSVLERLLASLDGVEVSKQSPRVLQEIGCIYLYDRHDLYQARYYLELASELSEEVALGEQTLNALEEIYESLHLYRELGDVYQKKISIFPPTGCRRSYEVRLAQLRYERLGEKEQAIATLRSLLELSPRNESALQLLAQIYIDMEQYDKGVEIYERLIACNGEDTKSGTQYRLRLIALYMETGRFDEAKRELRWFLDHSSYVDKLAIVEHYKRICREHDEWEEQLEILNCELGYYLHEKTCSVESLIDRKEVVRGIAGIDHVLREYADICHCKLQRMNEAARIYRFLLERKPDDGYLKDRLEEIGREGNHGAGNLG